MVLVSCVIFQGTKRTNRPYFNLAINGDWLLLDSMEA